MHATPNRTTASRLIDPLGFTTSGKRARASAIAPQADDQASGPPLLSDDQARDIASACAEAQKTRKATPLQRPFRYGGQTFSGWGLASGDMITHMVPWGPACVTNAEAMRRCAAEPGNAVCTGVASPVPKWVYVVGIAGAVALGWSMFG